MKKTLLILFTMMLQVSVFGQTTMDIPNGSFERWNSHSGYSVSVLFTSLPIYDDFSTPADWSYPSYPVNESPSFMGFNINVNTDLPLIKAQQMSGSVPDSSKALKLQTFMLSDIIGSTAYSLVSGSIDTSLTQMVFPSVLSIGTVNVDHFLELLPTVMANADSIWQMLSAIDTIDVNYYFSGGMALNGFVPTRLTGSYNYHSGVANDNGCVLLLGTRYDPTSHRREIVGGSYSGALTDVTNYTPFTTYYYSTHELDANNPEIEPDSLIVMVLSSATLDRQQGSYICIDDFRLWHDTCAAVTELTASPDIHEAQITWSSSAETFELEYGTHRFTRGTGTTLTVSDYSIILSNLEANTAYDVYLRSSCGYGVYGDWTQLTFTTEQDTCTSIITMHSMSNNNGNQPHSYEFHWQGSFTPDHWEVEYGATPYTLGTGTRLTINTNTITLYEGDLAYSTTYEFYVRSVCDTNIYGEWAHVSFTTSDPPVESIAENGTHDILVTPNPAHGACQVTIDNVNKATISLFSPDGKLLQTLPYEDATVTLQLPSTGIYILQVATPDGMITKKIINK